MKTIKQQLQNNCELYWWNFGTKTLSYKGNLKGLLKQENITFTVRKTHIDYMFTFYFKSKHGVSYKVQSTVENFSYNAKKFIQMELVRMGDKSQLYVDSFWRPTVTVNF